MATPASTVAAGATILASQLNDVVTQTWQKIAADTTFASTVASYTFASIPQGYRDLVIACATTSDASDSNPMFAQYNANSATIYDYTTIEFASGDTPNSIRSGETSATTAARVGVVGTAIAVHWIYISAYTYTAIQKYSYTYGSRSGANYWWFSYSSHWANTAAITSVKLFPQTNNFAPNTMFSLYAIP